MKSVLYNYKQDSKDVTNFFDKNHTKVVYLAWL